MTLEEGIIHAEDVARMNHEAAKHLTDEHPTQAEKCEACAEEHQQLAEWLKELKAYKEQRGAGMKIGDEVYIHGYVDEIRQNVVIIRNDGGYFGTVAEEITSRSEIPNTCGDAISRQAVMDYFRKWQPYMATRLWDFEKELSELPPVSPQQRIGRWIKQNYGWNWQCSECGFVTPPSAKEIFTFCPKCGAKMEVEE